MITEQVNKKPTRGQKIGLRALLLLACLAGLGLVASAVTPLVVSYEAESGAKTGIANTLTDATASGGSGIQFTAASQSGCALPAFPNASCTGVPAGTALTNYTGPETINVPGTIIDSKLITKCIEFEGSGSMIIRKSRINVSTDCGLYVVSSRDDLFSGTVLIEDTEIACTARGVGTGGVGTAVGNSYVTLSRVNIYGCENAMDVDQNITVTDSYIHDLFSDVDTHTDGIQFSADHYNGTTWIPGAFNVTIRHNTIYENNTDGTIEGTSAIISNRKNGTNVNGPDQNILIQDNLLAGGVWTIYCEHEGATGINYRVIGNHFSTRFSPHVGFFGISSECSDEIQSGNVMHETGAPIFLD